MHAIIRTISILPMVILLTACSWHRSDTGSVLGVAAGGLAGSALTDGSMAGTMIGAVGGGYLGNRLSK